jgi:hypothetical protein
MGQDITYRKKVKRRRAYQKRRKTRFAEAREAGQKAKGKSS